MENELSSRYWDWSKRGMNEKVPKMARQQETTELVKLERMENGRHHANPFPKPSGQGSIMAQSQKPGIQVVEISQKAARNIGNNRSGRETEWTHGKVPGASAKAIRVKVEKGNPPEMVAIRQK